MMDYFYIIHLANAARGQFTDVDIITWEPGVTRTQIFFRILGQALKRYQLPEAGTGVTFFYLEPNQGRR